MRFARWLFLASCIAIFSLQVHAQSPVKNFPLVNQEGKPFQLHDLKGKYVLVSFIYSRCPLPKMCPLTMRLSNQALNKWNLKKLKIPLHALAITLDPEHDTSEALKKYGLKFGVKFSQFTLARATPLILNQIGGEFNILSIPEGPGLISHNLKTTLLSPELVEIKQYKENEWTALDILSDLELFEKSKALTGSSSKR